jgi:hypothetical protein
MPYCEPNTLAELWRDTGLLEVSADEIVVSAAYQDFEDLWAPFTAGVGPAGAYCASLAEAEREALRESYQRRLGSPEGPFELSARAWFVRGRVADAED